MANETDTDDDLDGDAQVYGRKVGERLRAIRRQKGCRSRRSRRRRTRSSRRRCSAPTSGASGPSRCPGSSGWPGSTTCRSTSCSRVTTRPASGPTTDGVVDLTRSSPEPPRKITIDLTRLDELNGTAAEMLSRYLAMIQVQRQDFNGRVLTIRRDDLRAIACILDTTVDGCGQAPRRAGPLRSSASSGPSVDPVTQRPFGVYLHVPFCRHRCDYCAFAHLDRPRPPGRPVPGGLPHARRPAVAAGPAAGHVGLRRRRHARRWSTPPRCWPCSAAAARAPAPRSRSSATPTTSTAELLRRLRARRRHPHLARRAVDGAPRARRPRPHPRPGQRAAGRRGGPGRRPRPSTST